MAIIFVLFVAAAFKTDLYEAEKDSEAILYKNWTVYGGDGTKKGTYEDFSDTANNEKLYLKTVIPDTIDYDSALGFYTVHMDVKVYAADRLIYSLSADDENPFGSTAGYTFNIVSKLYNYRGEEITIEFSTPYTNVKLPEIYLGSSHGIYKIEIFRSIGSFLTALITLALGIVICGSWAVFKRQISPTFLYLGIFSINAGIYSLNDLRLVQMLFDNALFPAYLSFISLMCMPLTFLMFVRQLYKNPNDRFWYMLFGIHYVCSWLCLLLQIFDICDFKETLILIHSGFAILFGALVGYTVREIRKYKMSNTIRLNISLIVVIVFCLIIDVVRYYISNGLAVGTLANPSFMFYILVIGLNEIKKSRELARKGRVANMYEKMAYTDEITGLKNRMAHEREMDSADVAKHRYLVAMFDLNNLKKCNDTLGHSAGDEYIRSSARILRETFGELSKDRVFRIGGDEFSVILTDKSAEDYQSAIAVMLKKIDEYNSHSEKLKIQIAYGYAEYDAGMDVSLKETRSRADSMMYEKKFMMKKEKRA